MNLRHLYLISIILASLFFGACNNSNESSESANNCDPPKKLIGKRKDLNVSIFLDLSDRISPTINPNPPLEYWERDLGYIISIAESFETHLRNKRAVLINDNLKLFMHPLPENIDNIDGVLKSLNKEFTKDNATLDNICSISNNYDEYTSSFYQKTLEQKEPSAQQGKDDYPGSDIYDFFKSKVKDYCIKENHRNILFILTDGYMYMSGTNFKNSFNKSNYLLSSNLTKWGFNSDNYQSKIENDGYGFHVPVTGLDSLEVFVIGFAPKNRWELDVLNSYWSSWLKEMGVKNFQDDNWNRYLKQADLPSEIDNLIQNFMHN